MKKDFFDPKTWKTPEYALRAIKTAKKRCGNQALAIKGTSGAPVELLFAWIFAYCSISYSSRHHAFITGHRIKRNQRRYTHLPEMGARLSTRDEINAFMHRLTEAERSAVSAAVLTGMPIWTLPQTNTANTNEPECDPRSNGAEPMADAPPNP